jgi:hypothetical protein
MCSDKHNLRSLQSAQSILETNMTMKTVITDAMMKMAPSEANASRFNGLTIPFL